MNKSSFSWHINDIIITVNHTKIYLLSVYDFNVSFYDNDSFKLIFDSELCNYIHSWCKWFDASNKKDVNAYFINDKYKLYPIKNEDGLCLIIKQLNSNKQEWYIPGNILIQIKDWMVANSINHPK